MKEIEYFYDTLFELNSINIENSQIYSGFDDRNSFLVYLSLKDKEFATFSIGESITKDHYQAHILTQGHECYGEVLKQFDALSYKSPLCKEVIWEKPELIHVSGKINTYISYKDLIKKFKAKDKNTLSTIFPLRFNPKKKYNLILMRSFSAINTSVNKTESIMPENQLLYPYCMLVDLLNFCDDSLIIKAHPNFSINEEIVKQYLPNSLYIPGFINSEVLSLYDELVINDVISFGSSSSNNIKCIGKLYTTKKDSEFFNYFNRLPVYHLLVCFAKQLGFSKIFIRDVHISQLYDMINSDPDVFLCDEKSAELIISETAYCDDRVVMLLDCEMHADHLNELIIHKECSEEQYLDLVFDLNRQQTVTMINYDGVIPDCYEINFCYSGYKLLIEKTKKDNCKKNTSLDLIHLAQKMIERGLFNDAKKVLSEIHSPIGEIQKSKCELLKGIDANLSEENILVILSLCNDVSAEVQLIKRKTKSGHLNYLTSVQLLDNKRSNCHIDTVNDIAEILVMYSDRKIVSYIHNLECKVFMGDLRSLKVILSAFKKHLIPNYDYTRIEKLALTFYYRGNPKGMCILYDYYDTIKVAPPRNLLLALETFADDGSLCAIDRVGLSYFKGFGFPKDLNKAEKYVEISFKNGRKWARYALFEIRWSLGYDKQLIQIIDLQNVETDSVLLEMLSRMYLNGRGLNKDEEKGFELLKKSAELGNKKAITMMNENRRASIAKKR